MKKISLKFKTEKGKNAYESIGAIGGKESFSNKQIVKKVFKEKKISSDPLTVEIHVRIPWLAVQVELEQNIRNKLEELKLKESTDYEMVIE